ncbi:MAG TPA: peptidoglycan-associated lipoprotein Pal [Candidatus Saccharimonadales bacterium]|nr:peptidoglycan-associated lipoprotein Pal [Candidatus Saccharimonadales bacterium]
MKEDHIKHVAMTLLVACVFSFSACHKQVVSAPVPAPPPAQPVHSAAVQPIPPPPPPRATRPTPATATPSLSELFQQNVKDAFFDFDKADVRSDAQENLRRDADFLSAHANLRFEIEGHCDDRGGEEYNLALGDRRAAAVKQYLVSLGISQNRIEAVSLGKEHPFCSSEDEACWQQNRRGHMAMPQ